MSKSGKATRERIKDVIREIILDCPEPGFRLAAIKNLHPVIYRECHDEVVDEIVKKLEAGGYLEDVITAPIVAVTAAGLDQRTKIGGVELNTSNTPKMETAESRRKFDQTHEYNEPS